MTSENRLKIGLLGASKIAPGAIVEPAKCLADVEVVAVAARDSDRARSFAKDNEIPHIAHDYAALIDRDDVDLVYNALPINAHAMWSIAALKAGKHVLCEKPLAMNMEEAAAMRDVSEQCSRRLIEAFHYRYHPAFKQLLTWLDQKKIGSIRRVDAHFSAAIPYDPNEIRHRPDTGGGAMMDLGCYPLNWILQICAGEATALSASALTTPAGVDERLDASMRFGDIEASLFCDMRVGTKVSAALSIEGETGTIRFRNPLAPQLGASLVLEGATESVVAEIDATPTYLWQLEAVSQALLSGNRVPTEGDAILRQQRFLDAIYTAAGLSELRVSRPS